MRITYAKTAVTNLDTSKECTSILWNTCPSYEDAVAVLKERKSWTNLFRKLKV